MTLEVDPVDLLLASQTLTDLGSEYGSAISQISSVASLGDVFENGTVSGPWSTVVNTIWGYLADSQDNLNDTGRTLVRYVNAMCDEDSANAGEVAQSIADYNDALDATEDGQNDDLADPLPEADPDNPDQVVPEPEYDDAERPEGD